MRAFVWAIVLLVVTLVGAKTYYREVDARHLADFGRMYYAVLAWRGGGELYAPNLATPELFGPNVVHMPNVASPTWHLVVWPFTYVKPGWAFLFWVLCNVAAWAWALRLCLKGWHLTIDRRSRPFIALAIVVSPVTVSAFQTGQYVGLLMVPATLAWLAARRDRWIPAGAWLGFLCSHKPFVLLLIAWLVWQRRWRGACAAVLVLVASVACADLVFGMGIYRQWRHALQEDVPVWSWLFVNASIWAPWARTFHPSPAFAHLTNPAWALMPAYACAAAIGVVTAWRLRGDVNVDLAWTILWTAALLISPLGWTYYLWWAAGPIGALALRTWDDRPERRWLIGAMGGCVALPSGAVLLLGQSSVAASFTIGSILTWALLAIWIAAVRSLPNSRSTL